MARREFPAAAGNIQRRRLHFHSGEERTGRKGPFFMKVQSIQISECHRARALAGALLDGELLPETVLALERHMEGCDGCRQLAADLARLKVLLRAAIGRHPLPRGMKGRIRARLATGA